MPDPRFKAWKSIVVRFVEVAASLILTSRHELLIDVVILIAGLTPVTLNCADVIVLKEEDAGDTVNSIPKGIRVLIVGQLRV